MPEGQLSTGEGTSSNFWRKSREAETAAMNEAGAGAGAAPSCDRTYKGFALKVLQAEIWPLFSPVENQRVRWAELPCVKLSGTT